MFTAQNTPQLSRPTLEHAVEDIQAHLATISGQLDQVAQAAPAQVWISPGPSTPTVPPSPLGRNGSSDNDADGLERDLDDMGMWSLVLSPLSRTVTSLKQLTFLVRGKNGSSTLIVVRRLCLDISFMLAMLAAARMFLGRIHGRRTEICAALTLLWHAIAGSSTKGRVLTHHRV
ncbi:hypothetical protein SERLA73DRAFT_120301 [Serpula lacrymans var. lacrymans S7.3]|uniref:Uncharacterized protein n=1 Tax=Serpula lacrymans var. lacrymans (strain S7.3) TaxID=936435 RepID=F8PQR7_SERL3|nr:hypothetical protein SERLA73DRAFT_120301 [Serpula lacrymans var. lacrymans S7.3]